jgi:transcriptional regulator with XRE-family HTH domain
MPVRNRVFPRRQKDRKLLLALLKETREKAGLRQVDVARKLGIKQATVSNYELGERRIDLLDLIAICDVLGISASDFIRKFEQIRVK